MKDEQIIKALECCATDDGDDCFQCPYGNIVYKPGNGGCVNRCRKDAIDLINRQKAEIERLEHIRKGDEQLINSLNKCYKLAKSEAIKEFARELKCGVPQETGVIRCKDIDTLVKEMTEGNNDRQS